MTPATCPSKWFCGSPTTVAGFVLVTLAWSTATAVGQDPSEADELGSLFSGSVFSVSVPDEEPGPGGFVIPEPFDAVPPAARDAVTPPSRQQCGHPRSLPHPPDLETPWQAPLAGSSTGGPPIGRTIRRRPVFGDSAIGFGPLSRILEPGRRARQPFQSESWLYRPMSAGWFMGIETTRNSGLFTGYRFGWDRSHFWGWEMRFALGSDTTYDSQFFWDVDLIYYPLGDTAWRPYVLFGLGTAQIQYTDSSTRFDRVVFGVVPAVGLKVRCTDWLALRLECSDDIAFGNPSEFGTLHSISVTSGVEIRFGGSRKAYWPWNPSRHYW